MTTSLNKMDKVPPGWVEANISNEANRTYMYPGGSTVYVSQPVTLYIEKKPDGDRHRIISVDPANPDKRIGWYVKPGWLAIRWQDAAGGHGITF